jgi:hypothetical protein
MKNMKKRSIDTKRQKHRYNMFIIEQRGFAKINNNPCNHYKLLGTYYVKVENNILEQTIRHSYGYGIDVSLNKPNYLISVQSLLQKWGAIH